MGEKKKFNFFEGKLEIFLRPGYHHISLKVNVVVTCKSFLKVSLASMGVLECAKTKRTLKDFFHSCKMRLRVCICCHSILSGLWRTKKMTLPFYCPMLELIHVQRVYEDA